MHFQKNIVWLCVCVCVCVCVHAEDCTASIEHCLDERIYTFVILQLMNTVLLIDEGNFC